MYPTLQPNIYCLHHIPILNLRPQYLYEGWNDYLKIYLNFTPTSKVSGVASIPTSDL